MAEAGHIAHFNWGILSADWDDPVVAPFVKNIERVNGIAQRSSGFVWQLPDDILNADEALLGTFGPVDRIAANLTVWQTVKDLAQFVYKTAHGQFLSRRAEWFVKSDGPAHVIWPIATGHRPRMAEAREMADKLIAEGAGPAAYDLSWAEARAA